MGFLVHHERNATRGEEVGIAGVVLVPVREHRTRNSGFIEEPRDGGTSAWETAVDEHASHQVDTHVHAGRATPPARESDASHVVKALEFDHAAWEVTALRGSRWGSGICVECDVGIA